MVCWIALLCLILSLQAFLSGQATSFESVPDLEKSMYVAIDGYPCVRLLNLSGEIGCSNPGRGKVVAPVVRFKDTIKLTKPSAILISLEEFDSFFTRLSSDSRLAKHVAGLLVEPGTQSKNAVKGFSPDKKFPLAEFAPYNSDNFEWNPIGSGVMWEAFNFPIFLLSESSTLTLREIAIKNEKRKSPYTTEVVEFDLVMQTTKSGTHDSESCLREQTCLPLGGYSVWSALPPINISSEKSRPIILAVASMDSASFFRDKSVGADSPISGLISLLAAADALSRVDWSTNRLKKQLVFVVFTGESWGYLGSRRFLHELDQHSDSIRGLDFSMIETVFEIGSVGKSVTEFFAHPAGGASTNKTLNSLLKAKDSLKAENVKISMAKKSNPGLPPSSLMSFMRKNPKTSGILLEEFDDVYKNTFYHSHLDGLAGVNSSAILTAAALAARTLYLLAADRTAPLLSTITPNSSLVEELIGCLLTCDPGFSCELVRRYISPSVTCPSHYVGVISEEPYPDDVSRFVWNFLAEKTSVGAYNKSSSCPKACGGVGEVCVRAESDGKGECVISTTRYVPAYSSRLKFETDRWTVLPSNSTGEVLDPVWTESNWDRIGVRVYTVQDAAYDRFVLLLGVAVTVLSYLAIWMSKAFIAKAMKRD